jgi:hypothetical protein
MSFEAPGAPGHLFVLMPRKSRLAAFRMWYAFQNVFKILLLVVSPTGCTRLYLRCFSTASPRAVVKSTEDIDPYDF